MIGEVTCEKMIVALNKIDQIDEARREKEIAKVNTISYCCRNCPCLIADVKKDKPYIGNY